MGIPTDRIIIFTFAIGSALAAAAAVLVALTNPKIEPLMGLLPGDQGLRGRRARRDRKHSRRGRSAGLIMGVAETLVAGYISSTLRDAIAFALLIVILIVKPSGLLGRAVSEKV